MKRPLLINRVSVAVAIFAAALVSCRTTGTGVAFAPLRATTPHDAMAELHQRAAAFTIARSQMRVKATTAGNTQSFKASLSIDSRERMDLTIFTPIGTTAATIFANGNEVSFVNNVEGTSWNGSAEDLARSMAFYSASLKPAEMAILLLGLPPRDDVSYDVTAKGLRQATIGDVVVTFDPPVFPARHVTVRRGGDVVEIEHMELLTAK